MMIPSIWTGMYGYLPLHEALRGLHECGWQAFEISSEHLVEIETASDADERIEQAIACKDSLKLQTPQAHALLTADVAGLDPEKRETDICRLEKHIEIASRLNVQNVVIHPGGWNAGMNRDRDAIRKRNIDGVRRLGDIAGERGMRIGIENLPKPGSATVAEVLEIVQDIDHPAIGITLDTSHANMCHLDIYEMILAFGSKLVATHISDNDHTGDQHRIPGCGNIDWPLIMKAFREIGYQGVINLEIPGSSHRHIEINRLNAIHA